MKTLALVALVGLSGFATLVNAEHDAGCTPSAADPSTYILIDLPNGRRFYEEERDNPLGTSPPIPGNGFILGGGTWLYEETNGIDAPAGSMQRGGTGLTGDCFPPDPLPCLIIDTDPINDEACGHGPDAIIF